MSTPAYAAPSDKDAPKITDDNPPGDTSRSDVNAPPTRPTVNFAGQWSGPIGHLNRPSSDGRYLEVPEGQNLATRDMPMPLLFQANLDDGHDGAKQGLGNITRLWREGDTIMGEGTFDMTDPEAAAVARKVNDGYLGWTSIDLEPKFNMREGMYSPASESLVDPAEGYDIAPMDYETPEEAQETNDQAEQDDTLPPVGDEPVPVTIFSDFTIMGASLVPYQAFPDARIGMVAIPHPGQPADDQVGSPSQDEEDYVKGGTNDDDGMSVIAELAVDDAVWETAPLVACAQLAEYAAGALPIAAPGAAWDADGARQRVAKWASTDGSGSPQAVNWTRYGRAFLHRDPEVTELAGAFSLPVADVIDGHLRTVPKAVYAAAAALDGRRLAPVERSAVLAKLRGLYGAIELEHGAVESAPFGAMFSDCAPVVLAELAPADGLWESDPDAAASFVLAGAAFALPVAEGDPTWDAAGAAARIAKWASSDGSGDKDKINWGKYGQGFLYKDPEVNGQIGAYKFPVADVVGGRLQVIPKAVFAAAQRIDGAKIPDAAKNTVKSKLRGLYRSIGKKQGRKLEAPFDARRPGVGDTNPVDRHTDPAGRARRVPSAGRGVGVGPSGYQTEGTQFYQTPVTEADDEDEDGRPMPKNPVVKLPSIVVKGQKVTETDDAGRARRMAQVPVAESDDEDDHGRPMPKNPITRAPRIIVNGRQVTAGAAPLAPPPEWFDHDPERRPTPSPEVTPDGRVYAYIATWKTKDGYANCHTGSAPGTCITVPRSAMDYAVFHSGSVVCADGSQIGVGRIVMDTPHADTRPSVDAQRAYAHYANTGNCVAVGRAGEDKYGIWFAGALVPEATDEQIVKLRRSPLSGDWRSYGAALELITVLAVNSQGFVNLSAAGAPQLRPMPTARASRDDAGRVCAVISAGVVDPIEWQRRPKADGGGFTLDIDALAGAVVDRMHARSRRDRDAAERQSAAQMRIRDVVDEGRRSRAALATRRIEKLRAEGARNRQSAAVARINRLKGA